MSKSIILPKLIRMRDAPQYLGMDKHRFNREVRPFIDEIKIGKQGVAFERENLDAWVQSYKLQNKLPKKYAFIKSSNHLKSHRTHQPTHKKKKIMQSSEAGFYAAVDLIKTSKQQKDDSSS
ncbi:MAG: hypothetical protein K0R24_1609 [Gammaproteobacteria bacterium]|jgi:predicted DNA-binding transcriptional regulator AlpA|nr:hypothetical protein [Gammaproteobacteria bacterium]